MSTIEISLPDSMRQFIESKVAKAGYSTASDYIEHLVRDDQKRAAQERLEELLLEGVHSGSREMTQDHWSDLRRRVQERDAEGNGR